MPGLSSNLMDLGVKNICQVVVPLPFFMQNGVFSNFRCKEYTWDFKKEMIVLLQKKENQNGQSVQPQQLIPIPTRDEEAIYLGGSPLECPFDPHENFEEALEEARRNETFPGLHIEKAKYQVVNERIARSLMNRIMETIEDNKKIDGLDFNLPIFIPCEPSPSSSQTVMWGYNEGSTVDIRMLGPFQKNSSELTMDFLISLHRKNQNTVLPTTIHRQVHVVYEKTHGEFKADGKLFMEFVWNDPKNIFEAPPVSNTRVKLVVEPRFGDANPFLVKIWEEVSVLSRTITQLQNVDVGDLLQRSHLTLLGTSDVENRSEVLTRMLTLLNQPSVPNWKKGNEYSDSLETVLKRVVDVDRSDSDFTDHAWLILKDSTSLEELYECVNAMFSAVESKTYRPYLLPSNKTKLGGLLTKVVSNEILNFRTMLTVQLAVEITLDCGLNKMFKDYSFILGMCHLAEPYDIADFSPQGDNFENSLVKLKKLHCILEVLCLARERIALNMSDLETQTRKLLKYFQSHDLEDNQCHHFDVPLSSVASAIVGLHPVYWKLKTESSTLLTTTKNSMILSRDAYLDHTKIISESNKSDETSSRGYYLYIYRQCSAVQT